MNSYDTFEAALQAATADLPELTAEHRAAFAAHWAMVSAWNHQINLMGRVTATEAAFLHYRDALAAQPLLEDGPTLDVGSGGGFPGIPLAIAAPTCPFVLMEPRRKRASLLQTMVARLGLKQVSILCGRLEDAPEPRFAQLVTRATFSDPQALCHAAGWLRPGGRLIAFRSAQSPLGETDHQALAAVGLKGYQSHPYTVGGHARRLDVWILRPDLGHK